MTSVLVRYIFLTLFSLVLSACSSQEYNEYSESMSATMEDLSADIQSLQKEYFASNTTEKKSHAPLKTAPKKRRQTR